MKLKFCKSNIKRIILLLTFVGIISLTLSKTYASTIDESNISINIDSEGVCYVEELVDITAIGEARTDRTHNNGEVTYYPAIKLNRGNNIDKLYINNLEFSDYCNKWEVSEVKSIITSNNEYPKVNSFYAPEITENSYNLKGYNGQIKLYYPRSR